MPNFMQKKNGDDVIYVDINKKTKKGTSAANRAMERSVLAD
jgi:hypothetical protein